MSMTRIKIHIRNKRGETQVRRWRVESFSDLKEKCARLADGELGRMEYLDDAGDWVVLSSGDEWDEALLSLQDSQDVLEMRMAEKASQDNNDFLHKLQQMATGQAASGQPARSKSRKQAPPVPPHRHSFRIHPLHLAQMRQQQQQAQQQQSRPAVYRGTQIPWFIQHQLQQQLHKIQQEKQAEQKKSGSSKPQNHSNVQAFEDMLKQVGGKIVGFIHDGIDQIQPSSPKSATVPKKQNPQMQKLFQKERSYSDSQAASMKKQLEANSQQQEAAQEESGESSPVLPAHVKDPHLEDLSSENMDELLDEVLAEEEAASAEKNADEQEDEQDQQEEEQADDASSSAKSEDVAPQQYVEQQQNSMYPHMQQLLYNMGFQDRKLNEHLLSFNKGNLSNTINALLKLSNSSSYDE